MPDLGGQVLGELMAAGSGVVSGREVLAAGVTRATLRWALRRGDLIRLRPAVFTAATTWAASTEQERHVLLVCAAQRSDLALVACAGSAALLLGLPVPQVPEPQLASPGRTGRRDGTARLKSRTGPVWVRAGVRLTPPARTVVDCACTFEPAWGLAVADAAMKYTGPKAVWKEKGRQDALRDFPLEVVRFTTADHHDQQPWLAGYRRALVRAARLG